MQPKRVLLLAIVSVLLPLCGVSAQAQTYKVLYSFKCGPSDGQTPEAGLVRDPAGNLYGTTANGGSPSNAGVVFKIAPDGIETVLHSFTGSPDGRFPYAGLVLDGTGSFYGTTSEGGAYDLGTVFKVSADGKESVLHSFSGPPDGQSPYAELVHDSLGNFYGTTYSGGVYGFGSIFELAASGIETVLYSFPGPPGDVNPMSALVRDTNGNLYGTTAISVFELDANGFYTTLHTFSELPDGISPLAGVMRDTAGNLLGTTQYGGVFGRGTVYKIDTAANETVLYSFSGKSDGGVPHAVLLEDSKGNLYGTTEQGGSPQCSCGTIFRLSPEAKETVLYRFTGSADGSQPAAGLIHSAGSLYGTTTGGSACGTVFQFTLP